MEGKVVDWNIYIYICVCVCVCEREREREREMFVQLIIVIYQEGEKKKIAWITTRLSLHI